MSKPNVKASADKQLPGEKDFKIKDFKELSQLVGEATGIPVNPEVQKKINALKNVQWEHMKVEAKFFDELHELECKYSKLYEPFYEKRRQIVTGEHEPDEVEGKWALDEDEVDSAATKAIEPATPVEKEIGIKNFWLDTLQSFRLTAELVREVDEPILAYLQDIKVKLFNTQPYGYTIEFYFAENPYFTNKVLTKTYELTSEIDPKDPFSFEGPDMKRSIGSKIDWREGKNVTVKMVKKKLKSKNKKVPPKIVTKEEEQETFFVDFFKSFDESKSSTALAKVKKDEDEEDEEEDSEILLRMADFEIGEYLKDKIIPKAALYYCGEYDGLDEEFDDDEYEDEDEEGHDDDDDDEDDDDEDDEDDDAKPKGKGAGGKKLMKKKPSGNSGSDAERKPKAGAAGSADSPAAPSECKQN
jgi:hypothetical protein